MAREKAAGDKAREGRQRREETGREQAQSPGPRASGSEDRAGRRWRRTPRRWPRPPPRQSPARRPPPVRSAPRPAATDRPFSICTRNTASDKRRGIFAMAVSGYTRFTPPPQPLKFAACMTRRYNIPDGACARLCAGRRLSRFPDHGGAARTSWTAGCATAPTARSRRWSAAPPRRWRLLSPPPPRARPAPSHGRGPHNSEPPAKRASTGGRRLSTGFRQARLKPQCAGAPDRLAGIVGMRHASYRITGTSASRRARYPPGRPVCCCGGYKVPAARAE